MDAEDGYELALKADQRHKLAEAERELLDRLRAAEERAVRLQWDLDTANATILELSEKTAGKEAERELLAACYSAISQMESWNSLDDVRFRLNEAVARYRAAKDQP